MSFYLVDISAPKKTYLTPRPDSPIRRRHPPGPSAPPPPGDPPPPGIFPKKKTPGASDSPFPLPEYQALPRRRLVRRRLVSGDGVHVSATFSRPERGRTAKSLTEVHLVLVLPVFLKRRLVAAPLPLTQGTLKQPNGGTKAPVTNDLVLTGGLAIPESRKNKKYPKRPASLGNRPESSADKMYRACE